MRASFFPGANLPCGRSVLPVPSGSFDVTFSGIGKIDGLVKIEN
jgi:hypothetical protein